MHCPLYTVNCTLFDESNPHVQPLGEDGWETVELDGIGSYFDIIWHSHRFIVPRICIEEAEAEVGITIARLPHAPHVD